MILSTYPDNHNFQGYIVSYKDHLGIDIELPQEFLTFIPFNLPPRAIAIVSLLLDLIIKSIAF